MIKFYVCLMTDIILYFIQKPTQQLFISFNTFKTIEYDKYHINNKIR